MCPAWLLVVAVVGVARGTVSQCWEQPSCKDVSSESNILECIQLCRSDLTEETPLFPGDAHLQPLLLPEPDSSPPFSRSPSSPSSPLSFSSSLLLPGGGARPAKRSYSMEHFRWGKPVGRKRRPIKVFTSSSSSSSSPPPGPDDSSEGFPGEMRRELGNEALEEVKKDGYKMKHFRWGSPLPSKRYGGFMKSWREEERGQGPLITLFRNLINKEQQPDA
ncbi:proopiomelanocortin a [Gadus chalcogrammus]|uniref:proopiomelanocortin a n=1 Tax=Gadus chalcogrammus TaxID=1042646 RepID=UPI0024C26E83|nr:proopiomelanocortin a [Gadus chalcogrammus]